MQSPQGRFTRVQVIGAAVIVLLLVAMVLNTKFLTPEELAAAGPKKFDPKQTAAELYDKAKTDLPGQAKPLGEVVTALQSDVKAAADQYGAVSPSENTYVFPVTATATVTEGTQAALRLEVPDAPAQTPILLPTSTAVNGTVLRDAMGFKFADAPGQTDYQYVGDELKKLILAELSSSVDDPASLKGKEITLLGVISVLDSGGPQPKAKPVNVQPVTVEVGS
jgi:predicted lipoprotein